MSDLARYSTRRTGTTTVVTVVGEVDMSNAAGLEAQVLAACVDGTDVVVDLSGLGYLDSAGTRSLHRLAARCRAERRRLRLVASPSSAARRVLDLVGMADTVPVLDAPPDPAG